LLYPHLNPLWGEPLQEKNQAHGLKNYLKNQLRTGSFGEKKKKILEVKGDF